MTTGKGRLALSGDGCLTQDHAENAGPTDSPETRHEGMMMKRLIAIFAVLALTLAACGGGDSGDGGNGSDSGDALTGDAVAGESVYKGTCAACHGQDARGVEGLGKDLHNNEFVDGKTDDEMVAFLEVGRPAGDPLNETGVDMPPKGGNPSLDDQDLYDVVAYLRTLN